MKPRWNPRGPSRRASSVYSDTDRWFQYREEGEKHPGRGSEIVPETMPTSCRSPLMGDGVPLAGMNRREVMAITCKVKVEKPEPQRKRSEMGV